MPRLKLCATHTLSFGVMYSVYISGSKFTFHSYVYYGNVHTIYGTDRIENKNIYASIREIYADDDGEMGVYRFAILPLNTRKIWQ